MNKLKSVLAVTAGVIVGMAAGVLISSANRRLTINIDDSRNGSTKGSLTFPQK